MAYGTIKVDNITFTNDGIDQNVTVSGIVQSISGNLTATGTLQGSTIIGTTIVSGATVTGNIGQFTTLTGGTAAFTAVTGITVTGTTVNFISGVFTTQVSGATITGNAAQFTTLTGGTAGFTTVTGTTITGNAAQFTTLTGGTAGFTTVTGTTVTGTTANFATLSGTTITGGHVTTASGTYTGNVIAAAFVPTSSTVPTNGLYLPSTNNVALATNGTGRLFVDSSGQLFAGQSAALSNVSSPRFELTGDVVINTTTTGAGTEASLHLYHLVSTGTATRSGAKISSVSTGLYTAGNSATSDSDLTFSTTINGVQSERLRITSDGKVGVGTSSPAVNLHVSSTGNTKIRIADTGTAATTFGQTNGGLELVGGNANTSAKYMPGIKFGSIDSAFTTTTPKFGAAITGEASEAYDADTDGGMSLAFWTTPNDPGTGGSFQQRLTILNSGNVGIGTTSPDALLTVNGISAFGAGAVTTPSIAATGDLNTGFWFPAADTIAASTGGSERARIDSSGRLLVGTSTTDGNNASLQVRNDAGGSTHIQVLRSSDTAGAAPTIATARSRGTAVSPTEVTTDDLLGTFSFIGHDGAAWVNGASIQAYADGTWTDGGDTTDNPGRLVFSTTADGASIPTERLRISNAGTTTLTSAASTAPFIANISTTEAARIDSSGRLLVGTSSTSANIRALFQGTSSGANPCQVVFAAGTSAPSSGANLGVLQFADNGHGSAAEIKVTRDGGTWTSGSSQPTATVFSTTADGSASPTERLRITSTGVLQIADAGNISVGTTTGTKIGTATTQKLGFYNKTPVVQPTAVADATDAASVITQLNALLSRMRDLGLIAT